MMNEIFNIATYYVKGRPVYPATRRLLNLLFLICISSFIYETIYGSYKWLDISDYKGILDFFIKGKFFIPFSIFIVVYAVTQFLGFVIFSGINHLNSVKLQRKILEFQLEKDDVEELLGGIEVASTKVTPVTLTPEIMVNIYKELKDSITPEVYQTLEENLKKPRRSIEANFFLLLRAIIAVSIFKFTIPQFGWLLFSLTMLCFFFGIVILFIAYRLLDILPTLVQVLHTQAEKYLQTLTATQENKP